MLNETEDITEAAVLVPGKLSYLLADDLKVRGSPMRKCEMLHSNCWET